MNLLSWVVFGLVVGVIANALDPQPEQGGLLGGILLGIVGALFGGFLAEIIFGLSVSGFNLASFSFAVGASLVVLIFGRLIARAENILKRG